MKMHNAAKGGEFGANGEWYKGGQFVADKEDTVKGGYTPKGPRKVCVAPYEWVEAKWDTFGIWGEIEHNCFVDWKWNDKTERKEVNGVYLTLPLECYDVDAVKNGKASHGHLNLKSGFENETWFKRWRAYYGYLLSLWLKGERFISEENLANLGRVCGGEGRKCFRGRNNIGVDVVATIDNSKVADEFARVLELGRSVKTDADYRAEVVKNGEYIGQVGDKVSFNAKVDFVKAFDGIYGTSFIVKFVTDNGNAVVWFASNPPECVEEGANVKVVGTVKSCSEYNYEKQTCVTRCKVQLAA